MERTCPKSPIYSDHVYSQAISQPYPRHCLFCHRAEPELEQEMLEVVEAVTPIKEIAAFNLDYHGTLNCSISVKNVEEYKQAMSILNNLEHIFKRGGS